MSRHFPLTTAVRRPSPNPSSATTDCITTYAIVDSEKRGPKRIGSPVRIGGGGMPGEEKKRGWLVVKTIGGVRQPCTALPLLGLRRRSGWAKDGADVLS